MALKSRKENTILSAYKLNDYISYIIFLWGKYDCNDNLSLKSHFSTY